MAKAINQAHTTSGVKIRSRLGVFIFEVIGLILRTLKLLVPGFLHTGYQRAGVRAVT